MDITRRALSATLGAAAALGAIPAAAQGFKKKPLIIAHRGASGQRPESTLMAFRLAIAEGADFIEPDLVLTKDGHYVVRHENEISQTTDVALHPEFEKRLTTRQIQGQAVSGWFTEDFTLEELKTLRCRERLPKLRPESAKFDKQETIPTYQEVLDLAKSESARLKRVIGTYPAAAAICAKSPRNGDTGSWLRRVSSSRSGVPARRRDSHSSGSNSTPNGFSANCEAINSLASSLDSRQSTWNSIWLPSGSA